MPPIGRFTHRKTATAAATHITLQDGCFGIATLMRIAALFVPSNTPTVESEGALPSPAAPRQPVNATSAAAANVDAEREAPVGLPAAEDLRPEAGWVEGLPHASSQAGFAYAIRINIIIVIVFIFIVFIVVPMSFKSLSTLQKMLQVVQMVFSYCH